MLYIIGLGLGDEKDITLRGLEAVKKSQKVYMEAYTSLLSFGLSADGLSNFLYHYGETVSIPFFTETWRPDSFYEKIKKNRSLGLHTLCLLDIRVKEPTFESLCRGGKKQYEPPRYMSVNMAIEQLLEVEQKYGESVYGEDTGCVGFARLGAEDQKIVAGKMKQLESVDFGAPLHCLVIVGKTHPVEEEMLEFYKY